MDPIALAVLGDLAQLQQIGFPFQATTFQVLELGVVRHLPAWVEAPSMVHGLLMGVENALVPVVLGPAVAESEHSELGCTAGVDP